MNGTELDNLKGFTKNMKYRELISKVHVVTYEPQQVNLQFELVLDMRSKMNFVPIIYQNSSAVDSHCLIIFDVANMNIVKSS